MFTKCARGNISAASDLISDALPFGRLWDGAKSFGKNY
jgi:hypothetical protein